ncbi:unnamed protein product [Notodromas monacha]|uniref:VTT domain-containing protein n=1 Tax=Notodromas monacha TaxID=399045 RepID=A0A7R9BGP7_9CRUS|nr:unnamed protein product [Notodromas monacha]CAG0913540.1 unnamed protein product [Notodromas monacha]
MLELRESVGEVVSSVFAGVKNLHLSVGQNSEKPLLPVIVRRLEEFPNYGIMDPLIKPRAESHSKVKTGSGGENSTRFAVFVLLCLFLGSVTTLFYILTMFPELEEQEKPHMKLPRDIEDAKNLGRVLSRYNEKYFGSVLSGVFVTYIFLQTFAIPGSIFLSIMSGFLFPFPLALALVCLCSAIGASMCYQLSIIVGRPLMKRYFPERVKEWALKVERHKDNLLFYMLFLRITPLVPNWFINLSAPIVGVSLSPFFWGTFLGVAPPSFVAIQAGTTLHKLTSTSEAVSWNSMLLLGVFAGLSLLPIVFKRKLREKFD